MKYVIVAFRLPVEGHATVFGDDLREFTSVVHVIPWNMIAYTMHPLIFINKLLLISEVLSFSHIEPTQYLDRLRVPKKASFELLKITSFDNVPKKKNRRSQLQVYKCHNVKYSEFIDLATYVTQYELRAFENYYYLVEYFQNVSQETYNDLLDIDGIYLEKIHNPTYDQCVRAAQTNGKSLQYVPQEFRTDDIICTAVKQTHVAMNFLVGMEISMDLAKKLINCNHLSFYYMYDDDMPDDLIDFALEKKGTLIGSVEQTDARCRIALKSTPRAIGFIKDWEKYIPDLGPDSEIYRPDYL